MLLDVEIAKTLRDSLTCRHGSVMIVAKSVESVQFVCGQLA